LYRGRRRRQTIKCAIHPHHSTAGWEEEEEGVMMRMRGLPCKKGQGKIECVTTPSFTHSPLHGWLVCLPAWLVGERRIGIKPRWHKNDTLTLKWGEDPAAATFQSDLAGQHPVNLTRRVKWVGKCQLKMKLMLKCFPVPMYVAPPSRRVNYDGVELSSILLSLSFFLH
jgi:hypothetical protein